MPKDPSIDAIIGKTKQDRAKPLVSAILDDGTMVEMLFRADENKALFAIARAGQWQEAPDIVIKGRRYIPFSPENNLLQNEVVLLPSQPDGDGSPAALVADIQTFIHRYVQVSPAFETLAAHYILFSWVHDAFNELPYLRVQADYGCGKTRFLLTVGSLCYKPIFASGSSTVSPLFRILDSFRGTLIIDESDFRVTDEKAEIVKILNNGNARGFPVLRSEVNQFREFNPTAFHVFGPKIVASRGPFQDPALESRFLTETLGTTTMREDIPINLPSRYKGEALALRNRLLAFRFRHFTDYHIDDGQMDRRIEPRLNQIVAPLLAVIEDADTQRSLQDFARKRHQEMITDRGMDTEAQVLEVLRDMLAAGDQHLLIKDITSWFADRHSDEYERKITAKWIGTVIRQRLHLHTQKTHGNYAVALPDSVNLQRLYGRYGLEQTTAPSDRHDEAIR